VDRRITPALVEETTRMVQRRKEINVGIRAKPVQVANLKVGPEVAVVVCFTTVVAEEFHRVVFDNVLGVVLGEVFGGVPKRGDSLNVFVQAESEAVLLFVFGHVFERVIVDVAVQLDARLNTPVPLVVEHQGVAEKEARLVAAHVPVADGVTIDDLLLPHLVTDPSGLVLINPVGERPMLLGDLAVLGLA
jgi:hypothetical protein